ncbi:MAG: CdaR family protein [Eubacteriales bacterium]|nr:CdaR family protein [Eubacteriales bacterium]
MSNKQDINENNINETKELLIVGLKRLWQILSHNWQWKLFSVLLSIIFWGWLITENPDLTREKTFTEVNISIMGEEALKRNGLIVTNLAENLPALTLSAEVPQKMYDLASPSSYNVRIDLSRINKVGDQTIPVLYTNTSSYGKVTRLSQNEVTLHAEPYITRRRIPVQINQTGNVPSGFYASKPTVDPSTVTIAGPKSLVENVVRCVANYNLSLLTAAARNQFTAVSFTLYDYLDKPLESELIEVRSDSIPLDTLLVEQELYRLQAISINKSGIITGTPAEGYTVTDIKIDPSMLNVAGSNELMETLKLLDVETPVDISGATDTLIRNVAIKKPDEALHMSENAVYVTVTIEPVKKEESNK